MTTLAPGMVATIAAGSNEFLIHKKSATEYFILENRQQVGRDSVLPDAGLAIWHVDELGSNNNEQMTPSQHYECSLEQADNSWDLENGRNAGDANDLFSAPTYTRFGASTSPNSKWWDISESRLEIVDVSAPGSSMTLKTKTGSSKSKCKWGNAVAATMNVVMLQSLRGRKGRFMYMNPE